ncbi:50S ribosomal protein L13 [Candidatus Saccharibacteria bacterium]|jgi:large subunit ribosomal protein L13|nr:50S ribosomal protein L13 [Candidatus Saccharibacteria bacterium]
MKKTYSVKPTEITRKWYVLDASKAPLGRVSTVAASLLIGKGKPQFTPHMDGGDFVIIINTDKLVVTGGKEDKKIYYRHSGYPGGLYKKTLREVIETDSTQAIQKAVRGMLPVNKLRPGRLARLKIYAGEEHNHAAQKPEAYPVTKGNK